MYLTTASEIIILTLILFNLYYFRLTNREPRNYLLTSITIYLFAFSFLILLYFTPIQKAQLVILAIAPYLHYEIYIQ
jgi:hypothetical protein